MKIDGNLPIAKFAADLPGAMAIFESLGLDYACAGDRSLDDAAHAEGIAPDVVIASLRRLKAVDHAESWNDRPLADLTHHLVEQHHRFDTCSSRIAFFSPERRLSWNRRSRRQRPPLRDECHGGR